MYAVTTSTSLSLRNVTKGNSRYGHATAFCKDTNKIYKFDDSCVSVSSFKEAKNFKLMFFSNAEKVSNFKKRLSI